jgi:hypothetical protein
MDREQAEKAIRNAWTAGIISGVLTLIVAIIAMAGYSILGFSAWNLLDVAVIGGLTFGISRKSRASAVSMLIYFISSKIMIWTESRSVAGLPMALLFGWYFVQGVRGTYALHGLSHSDDRPAPQTSIPAAVPKFKTREEYQAWKEQRNQSTAPMPASVETPSSGQGTAVPVWIWAIVVVAIGASFMLAGSGTSLIPTAEADWQEFTSTDGNFAVLMPGSPTYEKKSQPTAMGPIDMHMFTIETRQNAYIVMYSDYPEMILKAPADKVLDGGRDGAVANTKGKLVSDQSLSLDGFPGREFVIEIPGKGLMKLRAYLVRQRLFQVMAVGTEEKIEHEDTARYLTSFRLLTR